MMGSDDSCGNNGAFEFCRAGIWLKVIASDGLGWEHVSVSTVTRCPTHAEMEFIREQFWRDDECVMLLSVPRTEHINCHPYCLHMWRPTESAIPRPPAEMVGPVAERKAGAR